MIFGLIETFNENIFLLVLVVFGIASAAGGIPPMLERNRRRSIENTFNAALASFSAKTRSSQVQRVMVLIETAIEQDSPLQGILSDLAMDYERLNDLMNKREEELLGKGILIVLFISIGLPILIAFIVGLFAPASKGFQIESFNTTFSLFFGAASAIAIGVSGRMLGRFKDALWWMPGWIALSMSLYLGAVIMIGG
ncbi:MAG: hypothetical protein ACKVHC_02375 [Candidatus Poseidoniales archaeon]